jgi:hypothetical protein
LHAVIRQYFESMRVYSGQPNKCFSQVVDILIKEFACGLHL